MSVDLSLVIRYGPRNLLLNFNPEENGVPLMATMSSTLYVGGFRLRRLYVRRFSSFLVCFVDLRGSSILLLSLRAFLCFHIHAKHFVSLFAIDESARYTAEHRLIHVFLHVGDKNVLLNTSIVFFLYLDNVIAELQVFQFLCLLLLPTTCTLVDCILTQNPCSPRDDILLQF